MLVLAPLAPSPAVAMALFGAAAAGGGGIYVLVTADLLSRVPMAKTSAAGGMTAAAQSLAHGIASPLVGMTVDRTHGYDAPLVALGAVVLPTSLAFLLWPGMRPR
jgi:predicted MFS family arabinose efflux permease